METDSKPEQIGTDEWVAREEARERERTTAGSIPARLRVAWDNVDVRVKMLAALALAGTLPLVIDNAYLMRVAGLTGLYVILALGLNVVAGFAGLLDLGYVAFYGIGAYTYAILASPHFDLHWSFWLILPVAVVVTGLFGLLLGSPSMRLKGDYLAIATLGFVQIAGVLFLNFDRVKLPFLDEPINITGGPNGIVNLDDVQVFGYTFASAGSYYYLILVFVAIVFLVVFHLDRSGVGRAWRAIREDELAAQSMGINVRWMKLLAFCIGAAIAGAAGVLFAAWQGAVFPPNFNVTVLIILYSMVVLGGVGSIKGAISGAILLSVLPELLRSPELSRFIFYGTVVLSVMWVTRRTKARGVALLGSVVVLGLVVRAIGTWFAPDLFVHPQLKVSVAQAVYSPLIEALNWWMIFPEESRLVGNVAFVAALFLLLAVVRFTGTLRYALLVPALYVLAFAWETRLVEEPSVTRMLVFGALLVLVMNYRPQGLFGEKRVERM